jgi:hypothetical protein
MSSMKVTRRELAAALAAAAPVQGQEAAKPKTDEAVAARESNQRNSGQLRKYKISALAEPSFVFKP